MEVIGLISATLTAFSFIPGVVSVWRLRPAPAIAISTPMYLLLVIGIFGWIIYGLHIKSKPVIYANAVTLLLSLSILLYKSLYG